ncbi:MAG: phospholipase D-like domain-containing protein [Woeseia sp.]
MQEVLIGLLAVAVLVCASVTAGHALLYKRDTRAVIAWVGLIVLVPLAGATMYWLLGVNRVRRRAVALRRQGAAAGRDAPASIVSPPPGFAPLVRVGDQVGPFPLSGKNLVEPLENGDEAFPPMLDAIASARRSIALATYIFDNDAVGVRFADALIAAHARGVAVRVIIDAVGQHYSPRSMVKRLRAGGVAATAFMPVLRHMAALNLRNHRKLLIVDGVDAFTGGMNIRAGNVLATPSRHPVRDLQFRVRGPVVAQLMNVFVNDWGFATREALSGASWFPSLGEAGRVIARAIPDGPDEFFEVLKMIILGALAQAKRTVLIATPYFLPDAALISALNTAALRGIAVNILLPEQNNLKLVQWASHTLYWQVLDRGCRIWHSPPPFDHSKLMLVDDEWVLVGSTNWDPRSMRLNFELNLECYDAELSAAMKAWFERRREVSQEVSKFDMDNRSLPRRLRDGIARLLSPYL